MLIRNAVLFTGKTFLPGQSVRLLRGAVADIGADLSAEPSEEVLDLRGDYLLPGFVDVHIHACMGRDIMRGESDLRAMCRDLFRMGVAAFCPTTMSASPDQTAAVLSAVRSVMARPEPQGARVLGAHLEAPFLSPLHAGAQQAEFFQDPSWQYLLSVAGDPSCIRLITLAPERDGSAAFIARAAEAGIHISLGHTDASAEQVHAAGDWGADHITHTFNAQTPLLHRAPGVPGAALTDDRFFCELICDGIHLHRDTVRLLVRCKGAEKAVAVTDAMEAAGLPEGKYTLGGQEVFVRGGAARLQNGTLAGSVLTMPRALENLIHLFGIDPASACAMCTSSPAASVGEQAAGSLLSGSPLPLTRWSRDWRMLGVIAGESAPASM